MTSIFLNVTFLSGNSRYQPQVDQLSSSGDQAKVQEMKPVKQTVTYDSSTGKMYEELGSSGSAGVGGVGVGANRASSYFQNYQSSYPYSGMQPPQYMASSYTSPSYVGPYDR